MERNDHELGQLLDFIVDHIDVPKSYYEKAAARHRSLGEWLHRDDSAVAAYAPDVRPQGSFRYGTVIRPLNAGDSYDLDNVCLLRRLSKTDLTQQQLKTLYGQEIKAYAKANNMLRPPEELHRCWRLKYADEINFHLDTLPCIPEDAEIIDRLVLGCVAPEFARRAVAITDDRDPRYKEITRLWPSSNPRGFAAWFEQRAALGRVVQRRDGEARAAIEDVPPYEWKTALQRSIQILKRHRDVMFKKNPELAPISMIITNLAAHAYGGEPNLLEALRNIVDRMAGFVLASRPRVPNPTDPAEDYAEKWALNPALEKSFWSWHSAVRADMQRLALAIGRSSLDSNVREAFQIDLTQNQLRTLSSSKTVVIGPVAPTIVVPSAAKPWG